MERVYDAIREEGCQMVFCNSDRRSTCTTLEVFCGYRRKSNMKRRLPYLVAPLSVFGLRLVPRTQLLAVELGRNRLKLNDWIYEKHQKESK